VVCKKRRKRHEGVSKKLPTGWNAHKKKKDFLTKQKICKHERDGRVKKKKKGKPLDFEKKGRGSGIFLVCCGVWGVLGLLGCFVVGWGFFLGVFFGGFGLGLVGVGLVFCGGGFFCGFG